VCDDSFDIVSHPPYPALASPIMTVVCMSTVPMKSSISSSVVTRNSLITSESVFHDPYGFCPRCSVHVLQQWRSCGPPRLFGCREHRDSYRKNRIEPLFDYFKRVRRSERLITAKSPERGEPIRDAAAFAAVTPGITSMDIDPGMLEHFEYNACHPVYSGIASGDDGNSVILCEIDRLLCPFRLPFPWAPDHRFSGRTVRAVR